jgi:hypothetical protein
LSRVPNPTNTPRLDSVSIAFVSSLLAGYPKPLDCPSLLSQEPWLENTHVDFINMFFNPTVGQAMHKGISYISTPCQEPQQQHSDASISRPKATVILQFHMRHFMTSSVDDSPEFKDPAWRLLIRRQVLLTSRPYRLLTEAASSLFLVLPLTRDAPYTIAALLDSSGRFFVGGSEVLEDHMQKFDVPSAFPNRETWTSFGILPCGRATGVAQFLCVILSVMTIWETGWSDTLDDIDRVVSVQVRARRE